MSIEEKILESLSRLEQGQAEMRGEIKNLDSRIAELVSETRDIKHTVDGSAAYMVMTWGTPAAQDGRAS